VGEGREETHQNPAMRPLHKSLAS